MALRSAEDFTCPICLEIFNDPVVLSCSHSFCKVCLQTCWTHAALHLCPVCKRRSSKNEPPCNLALRNLCEAFVRELSLVEDTSADDICSLHSEKLRLFCLDHQQPACLVCRDSRIHTNHRFVPVDEAAQDCRDGLRSDLKPLQEKLERLSQVQADLHRTSEQIKWQAERAEKCIKNEFQMLRNFLQKEEEGRIAALREEEVQKSRRMEQQIEAVSRDIEGLSETIKAIENELQAADISFLHKYKAAAERVTGSSLLDDPRLPSGSLINMAKYMGNLTFNIWDSMKSLVTYSPVILDPNSAISSLVLDAHLRSVTYTQSKIRLPNNPERFDTYSTVVGSESFDTGTHCWSVDVSESTDWSVGVIGESVKRKGVSLRGYWELWFDDGKYKAYAPPHTDTILALKTPIRRLKVCLDVNRGKLSFMDMDTNTLIYRFSQTFTERLFPFVNTQSKQSVRILPLRIRKINFDE